MKKYALLMLVVLGTTTVASAGPWACIDVDKCVCSGQDVEIKVGACLTGTFDPCKTEVKWCVRGNLILVDVYLTRVDQCHDALQLCKPVNLKKVCPGTYTIVARIYVKDKKPCALLETYSMKAVGTASFTAKSCDPCCSPWPWWFSM